MIGPEAVVIGRGKERRGDDSIGNPKKKIRNPNQERIA